MLIRNFMMFELQPSNIVKQTTYLSKIVVYFDLTMVCWLIICYAFLCWCFQLSLSSHIQNITWKYSKWYTMSKLKWSPTYNGKKNSNLTHKNLHTTSDCVRISNHQKGFEITQVGIIFHLWNIPNFIHIWIESK
jgi:hypothetical protein